MFSVISLYTGAGGLDLGLEAAGFSTRVAVEFDQDAVTTLRKNRSWEIIHGDIHGDEGRSDVILDRAGLRRGEPRLLAGGPPCQPFSKSGYWHTGDAKRLNDPRAKTLHAYLRVLEDTLPEVFLLENVPGLAFSAKAEGLQLLERAIADINAKHGTNYSFAAQQLNAVEYGVPQVRQRVFVIGHRGGKLFRFPTPTHNLPAKIDMAKGGVETPRQGHASRKRPLCAWDAIGRLPEPDTTELQPKGKYAALLPSIPEGMNYLYHTDRGGGLQLFGWRRRYWSMLYKIAKRLPAPTITAQPGPAIGPFHWKNRRLSSAELCALQTFPADFEIVGDNLSAHKQVGNAVPSALAEILGREIRHQFFQDPSVQVDGLPTLLPKRARSIPSAEPCPEVTDSKLLAMVGQYEEHPGTGKGPGAIARAEL
ncbi:MAG: DNA cytosine methyltransferase [Myxococcota bacterium]